LKIALTGLAILAGSMRLGKNQKTATITQVGAGFTAMRHGCLSHLVNTYLIGLVKLVGAYKGLTV